MAHCAVDLGRRHSTEIGGTCAPQDRDSSAQSSIVCNSQMFGHSPNVHQVKRITKLWSTPTTEHYAATQAGGLQLPQQHR